jgi:hypothetical protein
MAVKAILPSAGIRGEAVAGCGVFCEAELVAGAAFGVGVLVFTVV